MTFKYRDGHVMGTVEEGGERGISVTIRAQLKTKKPTFVGCFASATLCPLWMILPKNPYKTRLLAEREGFEPSLGYSPKHAFQAG